MQLLDNISMKLFAILEKYDKIIEKIQKEEIIMKLNIVMVEPEIPQNTGNIARTCAAIGAKLHLVHPLGFNISEKAVKRAGLDYWDKVEIEEHDSFEKFLEKYKQEENNMFFATP